ncbi:hypothetical protein [Gottschalkia purinilytica]|uniref:hypothetical protein n=1 Tax=Gottschalkia purinilytica TaxID=1503 RepID=UPI00067AF209|nr:hypothetical protein [Gottschalkia purinilytica]
MKKIVPIGVIIGIALQLILLSLFLNNKLFQFSDIVFHLVWLIFSMVGILFSWKYFRQNKDKKFPLITLSTVVFGEIIVF